MHLELAADDELLLVSAREGAGGEGRSGFGGRTSNASGMIASARRRIAVLSSMMPPAANPTGLAIVHAQNRVLRQIEVEQQTAPVPVFGDVRNAQLPACAGTGAPSDVLAFEGS